MPRPFIPAPSTARVEVVFDNNGGIVENQYHFRAIGKEWDHDSLKKLCEGVASWLINEWAPVAVEGATVIKIVATNISNNDGEFIEYVHPSAITGDGSGAGYQRNVTIALKWQTGFAGRSFRGRTFHVGLRPSLLDTSNPNQLSIGGRAAMLARYEALRTLDASVGFGTEFVVVSYMSNHVWRSVAVVTAITSVSCDLRIDTMRRRMNARPT